MNKKIILVIFSVIFVIFSSAYLTMDYLFNEQQNKEAHNSRFVKNCIPGGPDKIVPSIMIENKTHYFDLGDCVWILLGDEPYPSKCKSGPAPSDDYYYEEELCEWLHKKTLIGGPGNRHYNFLELETKEQFDEYCLDLDGLMKYVTPQVVVGNLWLNHETCEWYEALVVEMTSQRT